MAKLKTAKNMIQNRDEYARFFSNFRGVDFSSDHIEVADQRFAYLVNMWRDYKSGEGGAVETIPGFRRVYEGEGTIYGLHVLNDQVFAHVGKELYLICNKGKFIENGYFSWEIDEDRASITTEELIVPYNLIDRIEMKGPESDDFVEYDFVILEDEETNITTLSLIDEAFYYGSEVRFYLRDVTNKEMNTQKSTSVVFNNRLYILDGKTIREIYSTDAVLEKDVSEQAYIPTTHELIYPGSKEPLKTPGIEMEQRNILTPKYKNKFIAGTDMEDGDASSANWRGNVFQLKYGSDYDGDCHVATTLYPEGIEVYQYGVKLPYAEYKVGIDNRPRVPAGYPNAIVYFTTDGEVALLNIPPKPQENTWNPKKEMTDSDGKKYFGGFDYTEEQISNGEVPSTYAWPFAFAETYDGIEIIAENAITNINGIEAKGGPETIITHCTIATVFDNRLFLSGNPEFPTHIFWSGLNGETSYPDPTYFGITNNDIEGVTNSPVTAMLPVADQLMVLKKENASEGSVIFHTPTIGSDNVMPKIYPSTQGLPGRGCLGAACNFLDDPVFVSRLGLEAMGSYTNAKYERSIEHRSSLIDSKLLTCNLSGAELIEYDGYLLLLCDGKIFMADSRQTFAHQSGVMQYEWYYLEDIGVWEGQKPEFVYAMFPTKLSGFAPVREATGVCDELGVVHNLIGQPVDETRGKIVEDVILGYLQYLDKDYDVNGNEHIFNSPIYVEKSGAMTGGTFIPAERLYVIGEDLYFSAGKYLCKFYFDKRDKSTGIIPVEYYNFDGRRIFSGCATKMDNCGIPHLTKNTVKRSTVIKTRTFTHSNAKIKCRTNKKAFAQVGRIINGHEVFEGMDFADFTFNVDGKTLFSVNEKEKKWVEKQYFIYSDEYCEPFAIHYLAYRYNVAGRYKEK